MKYTSTIKSRQFIMSEGKKIFIEPAKGEMTDDEALAVAKSPWGKRLIEAGNLTFEKKIEVKEENVQHGMTIKPGDVKKPGKGKGKKPSPPPPQGGDEGNAGNGDGGAGDAGDESPADGNTEGSNTGEE